MVNELWYPYYDDRIRTYRRMPFRKLKRMSSLAVTVTLSTNAVQASGENSLMRSDLSMVAIRATGGWAYKVTSPAEVAVILKEMEGRTDG